MFALANFKANPVTEPLVKPAVFFLVVVELALAAVVGVVACLDWVTALVALLLVALAVELKLVAVACCWDWLTRLVVLELTLAR